MSRKLFILVNPKAGRKKEKRIIRDLSSFLIAQQCKFEVFETREQERGTEMVRNYLDDSFSDLVIIGGDGTINEAINGLGQDIPVSFVPSGSGDDFVKNIDIGIDLQGQFETILKGIVNRIDVGLCNERKFLNGVGIGFDGQIVADMQKRKVPLLSGQAKYYYHVLHILSSYQHRDYELSIDGMDRKEKMILLTVANGTTFGGGFRLTPQADIADGELDICAIRKISPLKRYLSLPLLQNGTHDKLKEVQLLRAKSVSIAANDLLEGHIDGEYMGKPPFEISILPQSLSIRVQS